MPMKPRTNASALDEILGWYGAVAVLAAYALVSLSVMRVESPVFSVLNLTGSAGLCLIAYRKRAWQPAALNAVWFGVALVSLLRQQP